MLNKIIYSVIFITAAMCSFQAFAAPADLSWVAPTERVDNEQLLPGEIAGYTIYYGMNTGNYVSKLDINDGAALSASIDLPTGFTYFFVITARDTEGLESDYSTEVVLPMGKLKSFPPGLLKVTRRR